MEEELRLTAISLGLSLSESEVGDYAALLDRMEKTLNTVSQMHG